MLVLGDPRTNQNPGLLTFAILLLRWHNVLANRVKRQHPDWSDEDIFQRARRIVIANLQNIITYEYLPVFLGESLPPYKGYNPGKLPLLLLNRSSSSLYFNVSSLREILIFFLFSFRVDTHPGVSHMFQAAAFRFGHTLIPPGIYRRDAKCNYRTTNMGFPAIRLCSTWWDSNVRNASCS